MSNEINDWLKAFVDAVETVATTAVGLEDYEYLGERDPDPFRDLMGSYIALVGGERATQIGVLSDEETCRRLSALLLGMEAEEGGDLSDADVNDGMGEFINIVAGDVKTKMISSDPEIKLGLPFSCQGSLSAPQPHETKVAELSFGEDRITVLIIRESKKEKLAA